MMPPPSAPALPAMRGPGRTRLWSWLPAITILPAVLLPVTALRLPVPHHLVPDPALLCLCYWGFARPREVPLVVPLVCGLLQDLLSGLPAGSWAIVYMAGLETASLVRGLVSTERGFPVRWAGCTAVLFICGALFWTISSVWLMTPADPLPLAVRLLITAAAWPPVAILLRWTELAAEPLHDRKIPSPER